MSFAGLAIFAVGCCIFSGLNLNIAFTNVVIPTIILGFGMTMIIIPTTTIIFSNVANHEMTNASSIQNLIKNVGCAIGTSSVGVLISRYSQIHQVHLVDRLTMLNTTFAERIHAISTNFVQHGHDIATAIHMAQISVYRELSQQATLCAFMSSYKIYAMTILLTLPLVCFLKKINLGKENDN